MATALVKSPVIDPRYACFRLEIRESRIHRRGVYALERIPPRRKVIEYTGERISRRETKRRGDGPVTYLFTLDDYWTLDGAVGGSGAEIINHSCDPNIYTMVFKGHILYMSKRLIRPGEELTVDYRFSDKVEPVIVQVRVKSLPRHDQPERVVCEASSRRGSIRRLPAVSIPAVRRAEVDRLALYFLPHAGQHRDVRPADRVLPQFAAVGDFGGRLRARAPAPLSTS